MGTGAGPEGIKRWCKPAGDGDPELRAAKVLRVLEKVLESCAETPTYTCWRTGQGPIRRPARRTHPSEPLPLPCLHRALVIPLSHTGDPPEWVLNCTLSPESVLSFQGNDSPFPLLPAQLQLGSGLDHFPSPFPPRASASGPPTEHHKPWARDARPADRPSPDLPGRQPP